MTDLFNNEKDNISIPNPISDQKDSLEESKELLSKKAQKKLQQKEKKKERLLNSNAENKVPCDDFSKENYGKKKMNQSLEKLGTEFHSICSLSEIMEGKNITLRARVQVSRLQGNKICFLLLRQQLSTVQALVSANKNSISKQMVKWCSLIASESIVVVEGEIKKSPCIIKSSTQQDIEIHVYKIFIESESLNKLPFQIEDANRSENEIEKKEDDIKDDSKYARVNLDTRLNNRIIDLRTFTNQAIFRISSGICQLFREYLLENNFIEIHTPKIIAVASEGGSNVFKLDYFKGDAYLAQSPQLYKQMLIASDFDRVFEIAPVFRAEDSNTHRHMTEFVGLDLEMTFYEHYHEVLEMIENLFIYIFKELPKRYSNEIHIIKKQFPSSDFMFLKDNKPVRFTFQEIVNLLKEAGIRENKNGEEYHTDLSTDEERKLGILIKERFNVDFYSIDKFPLVSRPFYTMPDPENPGFSNSYDFFMRGEEILSGSQRIHDAEYLQKRIKDLNINPTGLDNYINSFKFGAAPHGGGGIGLERVLFLYLELGNIRRTSLFPRDPKRLIP
ncbi:aspartate-tRNA(Asn) ligase [Pneumocystis carinii B80]|uniref:Aspartate--tRNA ligase, cytoplasmic n=1 Tax=Pneumocystis carinii (strain B80) TaxID=1408658 RepID=A0A0W4ZPU1_PNEC8|nr:aspartate-tRNA(Asn) ligase [Pneumocystis carinii B80]KTW30376.1 aspartate-tRNA(Asn) ligase [Pneumocystis carinii B80]